MRKYFRNLIEDKVNTKYENITLLAMNDKEECFIPTMYNNKGGNCAMCSLCDLYNFDSDTTQYIPTKITSANKKTYYKVCDFMHQLSLNNDYLTLKTLSEEKFTGYVVISAHSEYHAIAMINGLIMNNWDDRGLQTIEQFKSEMHYSRTPKAQYYVKMETLNKKSVKEYFEKLLEKYNEQ